MKSSKKISYFSRKRAEGKSFGVLAVALSSLLILAFSCLSFFRPFYEHKNEVIPTDSVTLVRKKDRIAEPREFDLIKEEAENYRPSNWERIARKAYRVEILYLLDTIVWDQPENSVLIGEPGYNLNRLGNASLYENQAIPQDGNLLFFIDPGTSIGDAMNNVYFGNLIQLENPPKAEEKKPISSPDTIPFDPVKKANNALGVLSPNTLPDGYEYLENTIYYTFFLSSPLTDSDLNYLGAISDYTPGILEKSVELFIHPAREYLRVFSVFSAIMQIVFLICVSLSLALLLSEIGKELIRAHREIDEVFSLKSLGMRKSTYVLGQLRLKVLPFFLANAGFLALYHIFMAVFKSVAGFSFYFPAWQYAILALPLLVLLGFELLKASRDYDSSAAAR
ncbi:MAG: hypothetical protein PUJ43_02800 [Bacillales bacterium]|nr:hypothetical protein [Bacillales bacterium]MDY5919786.1 hypothetical protein [Candidatus Enteromonas sp.]